MSSLVLDTGALIALERNDRPMWAALRLAGLQSDEVLVPSAALAQVWRGSPSQAMLSRALRHCVIASFDDVAWNIGELCGRARTKDVCDAQVALVASVRRAGALYTSDPHDMRRLLAVLGGPSPVIVRC